MDTMVSIWLKIMTAVVAIVVFCFTTFATKDEIKSSITDRLNRIETKLDSVILKDR